MPLGPCRSEKHEDSRSKRLQKKRSTVHKHESSRNLAFLPFDALRKTRDSRELPPHGVCRRAPRVGFRKAAAPCRISPSADWTRRLAEGENTVFLFLGRGGELVAQHGIRRRPSPEARRHPQKQRRLRVRKKVCSRAFQPLKDRRTNTLFQRSRGIFSENGNSLE